MRAVGEEVESRHEAESEHASDPVKLECPSSFADEDLGLGSTRHGGSGSLLLRSTLEEILRFGENSSKDCGQRRGRGSEEEQDPPLRHAERERSQVEAQGARETKNDENVRRRVWQRVLD